MQKWTAVLLFLLVLGFAGVVVLGARGGKLATAPDAGADAAAGQLADADAGVAMGDAEAPEPVAELSDAGSTLPNGDSAPGLPGGAPRKVTFGAILVQYRGAQLAPQSARPRDAALELAKQLASDAKQDFKTAVAKGDKGSEENFGQIEKGFLEPGPEFVLFSLPKGGVSEPVDSPRGFLIFKRIE